MLMLKLLMGFVLKQYFNVFGPIHSHYNTVTNFLPRNKGFLVINIMPQILKIALYLEYSFNIYIAIMLHCLKKKKKKNFCH